MQICNHCFLRTNNVFGFIRFVRIFPYFLTKCVFKEFTNFTCNHFEQHGLASEARGTTSESGWDSLWPCGCALHRKADFVVDCSLQQGSLNGANQLEKITPTAACLGVVASSGRAAAWRGSGVLVKLVGGRGRGRE